MMRELTEADKKKLKSMSHAEKKDFRMKWAQTKLADYFEEKSFMQDFRKIDITRGSYMSASRVFAEEGGTVNDVMATKNILEKCLRMGAPFVKYNSFSERYDFLYLRKEFSEELTKSWQLWQSHRSGAGAGGPIAAGTKTPLAIGAGAASPMPLEDGQAGTPRREAQPVPAPHPEPPAKKAGKRKREDGGEDEIPSPPDAKKKELAKASQKVIADACKVKGKYLKVVKTAENLLSKRATDESWAWAKSDVTVSSLQAAMHEVESAMKDTFAKDFLLLEVSDMKKKHAPAQLTSKCKEYAEIFNRLLDAVSKETTKLTRMHLIQSGQD
jgi:hypothetical protein